MKGGNLWNNPNQLSEEMVRGTRNIFLRLSESSKISPKASSDCSSSSAERLSGSTLASFSDLSITPSMLRSPSVDSNHNDEMMNEVRNFDPYKVNGKETQRDIGNYHSTAEVLWMSVRKDQLEYASDRFLVEQLSKACYTVGGQSFSAAEIEFVILKMKTPVHWPQLVRIFSAAYVQQELQESLRDYIQASVGISDRGKLLIPKLLQSFAKGTVEDSLLADWICHHLTLDQVAAIQDATSQRKQRLLGAHSFTVAAFDSKFRYLFLPDNSSSKKPEPKQTS